MLSYCLKCRKSTEKKIQNVARTKDGKIMLLSKCAVWDKIYETARIYWIIK